MKEELFDLRDKNVLFGVAPAMHDQIMSHIELVEGSLRIVYSKIGKSGSFKPYRKVTVTYILDPSKNDYSLSMIKLTDHGTKVDFSMNDPRKISELNRWNMIMFKFDIDLWGEMTLHFNASRDKKARNVELRFTPAWIKYCWEE